MRRYHASQSPQGIHSNRKPLKTQNAALRSFGKKLIYFSKLRFCLSRKP